MCWKNTSERLTEHNMPSPLLCWLELDDPEDRERYLAVWRKSEFRRPHDHPGFLEFLTPKYYRSAAVVFLTSDSGQILYPFHYLELQTHPAFTDCQAGIHLLSPFGYGGPLFEGPTQCRNATETEFLKLFSEELKRRNAVSEFVREDLFRDRLVSRQLGELIEQQKNVVVRLNRTPEVIWNEYKHKVRKNVNRAMKSNLRVVFDTSGEHLEEFVAVYHETMKRTNASSDFIIELERFQRLTDTLGGDGGLFFVHVMDGSRIVSTELLLASPTMLYSFLGGTVEDAFKLRPNDLLKHETILRGREHGFHFYVLGGGVQNGDGIFRYKESFDPEGIVGFFIRKIVHDPTAFANLNEKRQVFEESKHSQWKPKEHFFPPYLS